MELRVFCFIRHDWSTAGMVIAYLSNSTCTHCGHYVRGGLNKIAYLNSVHTLFYFKHSSTTEARANAFSSSSFLVTTWMHTGMPSYNSGSYES